MADHTEATQPTLEAATVYLLPNHQIILEELKLKLRHHGIKTTKSKLVRVAIALLGEQTINKLIDNLRLDTGE